MYHQHRNRRGFVLILVLVVIAMLTLASLTFQEQMLNERSAALTSSRQAQARAFAESGIALAQVFLDRAPSDQLSAGGIYDNPSRFADQPVNPDEQSPQESGRVSIIAPKSDGISWSGVRYGLQDESTKINLARILSYDQASGTEGENESAQGNTYAHMMLMGLPGMTDNTADAILEWLDPSGDQRENGPGSQYYTNLKPAYSERNAAPVSLEELLLVEGVTPELLFGLDAAKMGLTDPESTADGNIPGVDNSDGAMDHGWAAYLTLWSAEGNLKSDGTPKINLNDSDLVGLYNSLEQAIDQPMAEFIISYRLSGTGTSDGGGHVDLTLLQSSGGSTSGGSAGTSGGSAGASGGSAGGGGAQGNTQFTSILDLIGATAFLLPPANSSVSTGTSTTAGATSTTTIPVTNPLGSGSADTSGYANYLPKLYANCSTTANTATPGRININLAPRVVLMCIPTMTSDLADTIISQRVSDPAQATDVDLCPAWPLIKGIVQVADMRKLMPYINAGGNVFRAQAIGSFQKGSTTARVEAVIDATQNPSRIVFWNDISRFQGGFPIEPGSDASTEGSSASTQGNNASTQGSDASKLPSK